MHFRFVARVFALTLIALSATLSSPSITMGEGKSVSLGDLGKATTLVRELKLNENLSSMIMRVAFQTATINGLAKKHGGIHVFKALKEGTLAAIEQYDAEWTENLAKSYATHFTNAEMESILAETERSTRMSKIKPKETAVGNTMRDLSTDLLGKASGEVVSKVLNYFSDK